MANPFLLILLFIIMEIIPMKILIAETAGFCMGVKRAVDLAVDTAATGKKNIFTLGPLIHNSQTLDMLRSRGVELLDESKPPTEPSTVIIRAHGVPPQTQEKLALSCHEVIDGTCPKVKTVHKVIQKHRELGYRLVITGDEGHAEVIGLLGYAGSDAILIDSIDKVGTLPNMEKICLVSQTTFSTVGFDAIAEAMRKRFTGSELVVKKTICAATHKRQEEVEKLCGLVDALVVVGGKNSANTVRLAEIAREKGVPVQHIETESELIWSELTKCETVGITAGASTPGWMIKRVADWITHMDRQNRHTPWSVLFKVVQRLSDMNVFIALGGVAMYTASCTIQNMEMKFSGAIITALYIMSMYLWNGLACAEKDRHLDMTRYRFYAENRRMLTGVTVLALALMFATSLLCSPLLFGLLLLPTAGGILYQSTIVPKPLQKLLRWRRLQDIPASRDLFTALAWGLLVTFIPMALAGRFVLFPSTVAIFLWTVFLTALRSVIFDLRDMEGDRIMGRETLVTLMGWDRTHRFINIAIWSAVIFLLVFAGALFLPWEFRNSSNAAAILVQSSVLIYIKVFMEVQPRLMRSRPIIFGILGDAPYYISGLGAIFAAMIASI